MKRLMYSDGDLQCKQMYKTSDQTVGQFMSKNKQLHSWLDSYIWKLQKWHAV